jgi:hypothetical protein
MRFVPLVATSGPDGFRVAFAAGDTFEVVRHTRDPFTARAVITSANEATLAALLKAMASARSVRS